MADAKRIEPEIAERDLASAYDIPAIHANRIIVSNFENGQRLSFGELGLNREDSIYRTAVFVSYEVALSLHALLADQLRQAGRLPDKEE